MKKEKLYSLAYGLVLVFILVGSSLSAQYAYVNTNTDDINLTFDDIVEKVDANVNTAGIKTISTTLKQKLDILKRRVELENYGDITVAVSIDKYGDIQSVNLVDSGDKKIEGVIKDIIMEIRTVEPITYNGVARDKVVWIPVKFESR